MIKSLIKRWRAEGLLSSVRPLQTCRTLRSTPTAPKLSNQLNHSQAVATPSLQTAKLHATRGEEPIETSTSLTSRHTRTAFKTRLILKRPKPLPLARCKPYPKTWMSLRRRETNPTRALVPRTRTTVAATGEAEVAEGRMASLHRMVLKVK